MSLNEIGISDVSKILGIPVERVNRLIEMGFVTKIPGSNYFNRNVVSSRKDFILEKYRSVFPSGGENTDKRNFNHHKNNGKFGNLHHDRLKMIRNLSGVSDVGYYQDTYQIFVQIQKDPISFIVGFSARKDDFNLPVIKKTVNSVLENKEYKDNCFNITEKYNLLSDEDKISLKKKLYFKGMNYHFKEHCERAKKILKSNSFFNEIKKTNMFFYQDYFTARERKRKIICHLGPTNSGKTYHAMNMLLSSENGIYLAPLRLLAIENYDRMLSNGIKAELTTGDEHIGDNGTHISSTIEMMNDKIHYEVAVIDEIQMIADEERGWAWTKALMGVNADLVYVCGSESALPMIKKAVELTGDELVIRKFERMSELNIIEEPVQSDNLYPGDAVICFSRKAVYDMAEKLSEKYNVIPLYGAMAPEIRRKQAAEFAKGESVLVCTDVIGMGMNLPIKRVLFSAIEKSNGNEIVKLDSSTVKQIAGRAGRYGLHENGFVGVLELEKQSIEFIRESLSVVEKYDIPLWVKPQWGLVEKISQEMQTEKLSECFDYFHEMLSQQKKLKIAQKDMDIIRKMDRFIYMEGEQKVFLPLKIKFDLYPCPLEYSKKMHNLSVGCLSQWAYQIFKGEKPQPPKMNSKTLFEIETKVKFYDAYAWVCRKFDCENVVLNERKQMLTDIEHKIKEKLAKKQQKINIDDEEIEITLENIQNQEE